jgi:hypothetical protein
MYSDVLECIVMYCDVMLPQGYSLLCDWEVYIVQHVYTFRLLGRSQ